MDPRLIEIAFLGELKGRLFKFPGKVKLTVGRKSALVPAIIDTGAGATIITFNMLRKLGLRPDDLKASAMRFGVRRGMTTFPVVVDRLEIQGIPGCHIERFPVRAQSFVLGTDPFGEVMLCGIDLIRTLRMKISVHATDPKTVLRVLCGKPREEPPGEREREYSIGRVTFRHKGKEMTVRSVFDTGATFISIPPGLSLDLGLKPVQRATKAIGVTAMLTIAETRVDSISIAGTNCGLKNATVFVLRGVPFPIIGTNFMKPTGLVLDFSNDESRIVCPR